jgi:sec-independent protein translocase protein TatA
VYPSTVLAEIIGPDLLIVLLVVALLFGGTQLPKLARSLGAAQGQFRKGLREGDDETDSESKDS